MRSALVREEISGERQQGTDQVDEGHETDQGEGPERPTPERSRAQAHIVPGTAGPPHDPGESRDPEDCVDEPNGRDYTVPGKAHHDQHGQC